MLHSNVIDIQTPEQAIDSAISNSPLPHACADRTEPSVHLARWRAKDKRHDRIAGNFDVLERAQNVDFAMGTSRSALAQGRY